MIEKDKVVVKDSCIIFDLIDLGLLESFFALGFEVYTTEFIISEVQEEDQIAELKKYIASGKLNVDGNCSYESLLMISARCKGLSLTDCSVLELVMRTEGVILSSDKTLRNETKRRSFRVKGLLWIIEQLVDQGLILREEALLRLQEYARLNNRAPKVEITKLMNKFKQ